MTSVNSTRRATVGQRRAVAAIGILAVLAGGCAAPGPTWGEQTAHLNQSIELGGGADRRIVFRELGRADGPLTLLLLHGLGTSKYMWRDFTPAFEADYRVVVVDLLGYGDSSKPLDADYTLPAQAKLMREFIAARNLDNLVLLGESYGGGIALEAAAQMVENGEHARLRGLALFGAAALYAEPVPANIRLIWNPCLRLLLEWFLSPRGAADLVLNGAFHKRERITEESRREHARCLATPEARKVAIVNALQLFEDLKSRREQTERYRAIRSPALLVWGEFDRVIPHIVMCLLADLLPDCRCVVIRDCGHVPPGEKPVETIAAVARFLGEIRGVGRADERVGSGTPAAAAGDSQR